jgi:hypothetical protein
MTLAVTFNQLHTFDGGLELPLRKVDTDFRSGMWLHELIVASRVLSENDPAEYLFDEGEQGQPAFLFRREGDHVFVSVVPSQISDAPGDPDWQRIPCALSDFTAGVERFLEDLQKALKRELKPAVFNVWWKRNTQGGAAQW